MANFPVPLGGEAEIDITGADAGDVFTAMSGDVAALEARIVKNTLVLRGLTLAQGVPFSVTDSAGSKPLEGVADVVAAVLPRYNLSLDLANARYTLPVAGDTKLNPAGLTPKQAAIAAAQKSVAAAAGASKEKRDAADAEMKKAMSMPD